VTELRKRISVRKLVRQKCDLETFYVRRLSDIEFKKKYEVEILKRFVALESLHESLDINSAW
jgi:hypothetical protein